MYRFLQIFDRPVYHIRALAEQSQTLWEELWAYFRDRYFTLDIEGRYEHLDLGTGTLLSLRNIIVGIFVGIILAAAFASEVGDFSRFRSGRQVTAYFGLAPKQRSSADSVRLGGISGAGNALVRRLAVEGSWSYVQASHQPKLMPKGSGVPLEVRMHGRKGSERLLRRREEMLARGMPQAKANAATAAELVRWLWALGAMCREATE